MALLLISKKTFRYLGAINPYWQIVEFFFSQIRGTTQTVLWKFFPHIRQRSNFRGTTQTALWKFFPHKNHEPSIFLI